MDEACNTHGIVEKGIQNLDLRVPQQSGDHYFSLRTLLHVKTHTHTYILQNQSSYLSDLVCMLTGWVKTYG